MAPIRYVSHALRAGRYLEVQNVLITSDDLAGTLEQHPQLSVGMC